MERDRDRDPDKWAHVWQGEYRSASETRVFRNFREGELDPPGNVVWFYGLDFGFSTDPTACVRFCILGDRTLYIDQEAYETGTPTESLPALIGTVEGSAKWPMRADNARPETIDYLRRHGFPKIRACRKGKGSVEDGVMFLQSMDIVIHPRCGNTLREFRTYAYKTDPRTNEILPVIEDKNNHAIDAIRYGAEGLHRKGRLIQAPAPVPTDNRLERPPDYRSRRETADSWKTA
jgi:phage terminase large subunit